MRGLLVEFLGADITALLVGTAARRLTRSGYRVQWVAPISLATEVAINVLVLTVASVALVATLVATVALGITSSVAVSSAGGVVAGAGAAVWAVPHAVKMFNRDFDDTRLKRKARYPDHPAAW